MKRLFATLSVFALLLATVVPVFAGTRVGADGTVVSDKAGETSDGIPPVARANSQGAGDCGAQHYNLVQSLTQIGLLAADGVVRPAVVTCSEPVLGIQTKPAVLNPSTFSF